MAAQQTNLCVYEKGQCLQRNAGTHCTALSLYVMSSVKPAAGEDWGTHARSLSDCVVTNFTKSKDFRYRIKRLQTRRTELGGAGTYPSPTAFVCARCKTGKGGLVSAAICLFPLVPLLLEQVWDLSSWQEGLRDCLSPQVDRGIPCDGAATRGRSVRGGVEENHLPRVSNLTLAGLVQAALLSSNKQHRKFSTKMKMCQGVLGAELATAFKWDDVKTESGLLYCPHSVHLITAALLEPRTSHWEWHKICCG